jgi:hypothetical protein
MMTRYLLGRLLTLSCAAIFFANTGFAALPPLTPDQRDLLASEIVSGEVRSVRSHVEQLPYGTNTVYQAELIVTAVQKSSSVVLGQVIQITYWRALSRPSGWTGPVGQYYLPEVRQHVTAFLHSSEQGLFHVLEPNGIDL